MESLAPLMMLGIRVREVHRLTEGHIWLPEDRLLLIDAALTPRARSELASLLLASGAEC